MEDRDSTRVLHTTLGPMAADDLGTILPHEHLFVDFRPSDSPGFAQASSAEFTALMGPLLTAAAGAGVAAIIECTPAGLGRRADLIREVSHLTGVPVALATGVYREPWVPGWVYQASDRDLEQWMVQELTGGVDASAVPAGFIKISAGEDGVQPVEERILRAAVRAATRTGALIGTHTTDGTVVLRQLEIAVAEGLSPDRFLSIHTQTLHDEGVRRAILDQGAWIEFDDVGQGPDHDTLDLVLTTLEAGYGGQMLLSHDAGWFDPALPGGGTPRPFTHLTQTFLPALRTAGVDDRTIDDVCRHNPFRAFAR